MDVFSEYIVTRKKRGADYAIIAGIVAAACALSWILFLILLGMPNVGGILFLLIAVVWWGAYKLIQRRSVEFEYILTNHELDIDRIVGKGSRKRLCTINFQKIDRCASITDAAFENNQNMTVKDYAGDMSAQRVYFVDYTKEAERFRVIFQPNGKILAGLKKANPRMVTVRDEDIDTEM